MSLIMHVEKQLANFHLKIDLEVKDGVIGLLGYSGCGKTMTLKMIAGIITPDRGKIILNGKTLFDDEKKIDLKPQQRNVGLMFQSYALFNSMTVYDNIAISMKKSKESERAIVEQYLKLLEIENIKHQKPRTLSGGQKQRVALARILAQEPEILMLDEPFSALDSHLRYTIESEFKKALKSFGGTVLYVSHNRNEIYKYCEQTAVLENGKIVEIKPTTELFKSCETVAAAKLTGCRNITKLEAIDKDTLYARAWNQMIYRRGYSDVYHFVGIREGDIRLTDKKEPNGIRARIGNVLKMPDKVKVTLWLDEVEKLIFTCSNREYEQLDTLLKEDEVTVLIEEKKLLLLK